MSEAGEKVMMQWKDPETKRKLYLAVLAASSETITYPAAEIAKYMGCTPKAVTHQIPIIKADVEALKSGNPISVPTPTPRKRAAKAVTDDAGADGEAAEGASPTKKAKTPAKPRAKKAVAAVKEKNKENDAEDGENGDTDGEGEGDVTTTTAAPTTTPKKRAPAKPRASAKKPAAKKAVKSAANVLESDSGDEGDAEMKDADGEGANGGDTANGGNGDDVEEGDVEK